MEENRPNKEVNNNKSGTDSQNNSDDIFLNVLLPKLLYKNDSVYKFVKKLNKVISFAMNEKRITNITLTGPYDSGKSSILQALSIDHKDEKENGYIIKHFYRYVIKNSSHNTGMGTECLQYINFKNYRTDKNKYKKTYYS